MGNKYKMFNSDNGAIITTNQSYLAVWLARGFDIIEVILEDESSNEEEEKMLIV